MSVSPQSRIKILEAPVAAPGVCCLCGSAGGDSRTFIDFGKQLDWYGAVYFCSECINECVLATGHVKVSLFKKLDIEHQTLEAEHEKLQQKYEAVKHALSFTLDGLHGESCTVDDLVSRVVDAVEESRTHALYDADSDFNYSDSDESCDVQRLGDILQSPDLGLLNKPPKQRKSSPEV